VISAASRAARFACAQIHGMLSVGAAQCKETLGRPEAGISIDARPTPARGARPNSHYETQDLRFLNARSRRVCC